MRWPSDQDYNEAVQNPGIAFSDQELKSGRVELNALGLPKARSGNFATIYRVETISGAYAVRCFRYDNPEHSLRYPTIASYLSQNPLPYMVSFRFMSQGIRVGPNWYPTVKMKWVEGDSLVSYIEKNLSSQAALQNLGASWIQMLTDLHRTKIAHGDLQHGNVLVVHGKLRLVDYDGMYVPALDGSRGLELGHRNYQHPQRTELDFGPQLDNFSAWLIYVSLVALAAQPKLWMQLKAGDECLLFRREDLDNPDQSAAFRFLKGLPDKHIRRLADQMEQFLWLPPDQVPLIADRATESEPRDRRSISFVPGGSWIEDYSQLFANAPEGQDFTVIEAGDPTWIQDHVDQNFDPGSFANSANTDRFIAATLFLTAFSLSAWLSSAITPTASVALWISATVMASGLTILCWRIRYRYDPVFQIIRAAQSDLRRAGKESDAAQQAFANIKAKRLQRRDTYLADSLRLHKRQGIFQADEAKRLGDIDTVLQAALRQINNTRRSTTTDEGTEKRKLLENIGTQISGITRTLLSLPDQELQESRRLDSDVGTEVNGLAAELQQITARRDADLVAALKNYQDQVVNSHLHKVRISAASIPGIGPQLKQRLAVAGYVSAADIGARYARVPGIGTTKAAALIAWRNQLELPIRLREAPKSLQPHQIANIEQRYETQIRQLQRNLAREQNRLNAAKQSVKTRFLDQKQHLELQKADLESTMRLQTLAIESKFNDKRRVIANDEQGARLSFQNSNDECRNQFRAMAALLVEEAQEIKKGYKASLEVLNKELGSSARVVRELSWRRERAARKHSAYASLSFKRYALRALGRP
ncbi:MAG: hypothetical protein ACR2IV_03305 [Bryobacteraceae bacterium]